MLEVELKKHRRGLTVEAAFTLEAGAALGLFGPSGAGKSTVLACLAGIEAPDHGHIRLGDRLLFPPPLPLHRRSVGYLTQEPNLFPHLTVEGNVAFGLPRARARTPEQREWLERLRRQLHLDDCWSASVARISAGQARRVALARMLAHRPALVLLDEPFTGLDRALVRGLIADLLEWRQALGFTLIAVDHQAEVLSRLCPQVLAMEAGRIVERGTWAELRLSSSASLRALLQPL
ncbi:MAG TPA: ATP-binding cassette domain-containing protein [Terriglobales bacterium]|nr:ATP-binding cassette domain-containing protein [Terriglobales bacterium]